MKNNSLLEKYVPLNSRAFFYITGPDALRYLNGQISQDLNKVSHSNALFTCVTNAKGKLQGVGFVRKWEDGYLFDCPLELREDLFQRLDMYLIADDAELTDKTDVISLYHVFEKNEVVPHCSCNRFGVEGFDVLSQPKLKQAETSELEKNRILVSHPAWGAELTEGMLPPEAKLESRDISYTKGCYTGQEVISRMKSSGKVNRALTSFTLSEQVTTPFDIPNPEKPDGKPAGQITSTCFNGKQWVGLGYVNRKFEDYTDFKIDNIEVNVTT